MGYNFFVDYENVNTKGLMGVEYLHSDDCVLFFYSDSANLISKQQWRVIENSKCEVRFIKLIREGKNGLDFYIASELANVIAEEPFNDNIIVSHDKGFNAVCDYWKRKDKHVVQVDSIVDFYAQVRQKKIGSLNLCSRDKANFDVIRMNYASSHETENMLRKIYAGTEYVSDVNEIKRIYEENHDLRAKYRAFSKAFGKKKGIEAYRLLQDGIYKNYMNQLVRE